MAAAAPAANGSPLGTASPVDLPTDLTVTGPTAPGVALTGALPSAPSVEPTLPDDPLGARAPTVGGAAFPLGHGDGRRDPPTLPGP